MKEQCEGCLSGTQRLSIPFLSFSSYVKAKASEALSLSSHKLPSMCTLGLVMWLHSASNLALQNTTTAGLSFLDAVLGKHWILAE